MIFMVAILYALFAYVFGLGKETLNYSEPFFLIGSRMLFAGILLLGYQFFWDRRQFTIKPKHLLSLFLFGVVSLYLTNISEIWGLQHMISSKACLIYSLSPFLTALIAYFTLRERLNSEKWLGLCVGFTGLIPIFMTQTQGENLTGEFMSLSLAEVALLIAVLCSVYGWTLLKKITTEYGYSPVMANGIGMTIGGILALSHSYISGEAWTPIPVSNLSAFIQYSLWLCLISNIICYNLYGYLLKYYTATFMSFAGLITPLFASFFGWVFYGETITWHFFASIALFSVGLTIFYQEELKREKIHVKPALSEASQA